MLEPLSYLAGKGFEVDLVGVDKSGRVNPKDVFEKMRPDTLLVTIMHANNETGVIQPVKEIGDALYDTPTYFHVDAAQTFGKLVPELRELKYDMLSISGHKVYGPQGIGALVLRRKAYRRPPVKPIMFGGGQEVGLRPGTLPVALIAGLGKASEISENEYIEWHKKVSAIKEEIIKQLEEVEYIINGDQKHCMPHTLSVSFPGINSEALMIATQDYCAISNGSACTSHDYKPSHVLTAMGLDEEIVSGTVRISWGPSTGKINLSGLINTVLRMKG